MFKYLPEDVLLVWPFFVQILTTAPKVVLCLRKSFLKRSLVCVHWIHFPNNTVCEKWRPSGDLIQKHTTAQNQVVVRNSIYGLECKEWNGHHSTSLFNLSIRQLSWSEYRRKTSKEIGV